MNELPPPSQPGRFGLVARRTPVEPIAALSSDETKLFVKRDDLTHPGYGGNKVRKLVRILDDARARGATRLLTIGAAGSHHVLATTYFGRQAGFDVEAVLLPQRSTPHVVANLRAGLGLGLQVFAARSALEVPLLVASRFRRGTYFVPIGGSNMRGALGYVDAAFELAAQVRTGECPEPDVCFVTLGSGGTYAGLAAGFEKARLKTRLVGVTVSDPAFWVEPAAKFRAWRMAMRIGGVDVPNLLRRMNVTRKYLGDGYGIPTEKGDRAMEIGAALGLTLDGTYTAKTFAAVLDAVHSKRAPVILYWHTLSSASLSPLLAGAPDEQALPHALRPLLLEPATTFR